MRSSLLFIAALVAPAAAQEAADYAADAKALDDLIVEQYAYPERWPGGVLPDSDALSDQRAAVRDGASLLAYAEARVATLADHHVMTGSSFSDSWAIVPSYSDLWIELVDGQYLIDAVREGSPAQEAGIEAGDQLVSVGGVPAAQAIEAFWSTTGITPSDEWNAYAARVITAGRRDRTRQLSLERGGNIKSYSLPSLYDVNLQPDTLVTTEQGADGAVLIRFHDSLGNNDTIAAFDAIMESLPRDAQIVIDLTGTPGGGNTTVARAIMGWFVDAPRFYQRHSLPIEERQYGVVRQWTEEVHPREGNYHPVMPRVIVGRWTGSMGEGLGIGFDALGAEVCGGPTARLLGAVYDFRLPTSNLLIKLPVERMMHVDGTPREAFSPPPCA